MTAFSCFYDPENVHNVTSYRFAVMIADSVKSKHYSKHFRNYTCIYNCKSFFLSDHKSYCWGSLGGLPEELGCGKRKWPPICTVFFLYPCATSCESSRRTATWCPLNTGLLFTCLLLNLSGGIAYMRLMAETRLFLWASRFLFTHPVLTIFRIDNLFHNHITLIYFFMYSCSYVCW